MGASTAVRAESVVILNSEDASYSIVDRATRTEVTRLPLGREPHHLAVTPDGKEVLLASTVTNDLVAIDTTNGQQRRVVRDIVDPYQLGFSADGKWFVTAAYRLDHIDIYRADGFRLAGRIFMDGLPSHLAFDTDSKTVFVTLQQSNRVVALDLATQAIKWVAEVGKAPAGVIMLPDNKRLLVALTGEDAVVTVDPKDGAVSGRLQTGKGAHQFFPKGDGRHWFLSNRIEGTVSLIDTQDMRVAGSIRVPGGPDCMDITADGKELWITQRFLRRVAVVDLAQMKVVASIPVGKSPHGVYILKADATSPGLPIRAASTEPVTR
ncbi:MAG: PQQ-binding-like beta-propeller repeat protein [Proteobacteria bacterium]|nr:PQQ-binding-like beta-propeller repeat protein [Pseudomonadota bacterium]